MKKSILLLVLSLMFMGKSNAQNWSLGGNNLNGTPLPPYILGGITVQPYDVYFWDYGNQYMDLQYNTGALGIGLNYTPNYQLDILCSPSSKQDVNISCPTCGQPNAVGYRIGGNYVLWHNGEIRNIYVGVGAGNANTGIYQNTFVGGNAGINNLSDYNTAMGYEALTSNTYGAYNTAIGMFALYTQNWNGGGTGNIYATLNTAVGAEALYNNNPTGAGTGMANTAVGMQAMYENQTGNANTATGEYALFDNTTGNNNTADGAQALDDNVSGMGNTASGNHALANTVSGSYNSGNGLAAVYKNLTGSYNTGSGYQALNDDTAGSYNTGNGANALVHNLSSYNTATGYQALQSNTTGSYNAALGYDADVSASNLSSATAIGANAVTTQSNEMVLGTNNVNVTMGLSGKTPPTGLTRLDISTQWGSAPYTFNWSTPGPGWVNSGLGTGWSGLRFDDLKSISHPGKNPGPGYLSVDTAGNVIYVDTAFASGGSTGIGIGYCSPFGNGLTTMVYSGGYTLPDTVNFYFAGNNYNDTSYANVAIGNGCGYTPKGKLDVYQNSGVSTGSTGIYVENDDAGNSIHPTIGLQSIMGYTPCYSSPLTYPKVAGWFESEYCPTPNQFNYAIYIPWISTTFFPGIESIGYPWGYFNNYGDWLQVVTDIYAAGVDVPSDRKFKQDFTPIKNPMGKIDSLKPTYFYFDTTGRYNAEHHFSSRHQVGFIAQNVDSVLPEAVKVNDSNEYAMDYAKMTPLIVAGMQQQQGAINRDSIKNISQQNTIDSLRSTLDSLRSAFQNIQNCLNELCNEEGGVLRGNKGNGGPNTNATKSQDITLSGSIGGTPMLYQNTPNPFGTGGTKINYYLPEGTVGASIIFYDTYGNMLKTVQLSQTGNSTLNITPDNLSNGIYSYSLIVNGAVIDTKRMLLQK